MRSSFQQGHFLTYTKFPTPSVLSLIDPGAFQQCLLKWARSNVKLGVGDVIPIDGKTLRRSHHKAAEQAAVEIVSAWAASQRLTLGQVKVAAGSNEIAAVPQVLDFKYRRGDRHRGRDSLPESDSRQDSGEAS